MLTQETAERTRRPAGPFDYYWDTVEPAALSGYITTMEGAFIERCLDRLGPRPDLVVDAGAGSGRFTRMLAARSRHVIATEMVPQLIEMLTAIGRNVSARLSEPGAVALPVEAGSADMVIAIDVADFTQNPAFHREVQRALRPGGAFVTTLQNRTSWKGLIGRFRTEHHRAEIDAVYYTWALGDLTASLRDAGLEIERMLGFNWLPFTRDSDSALVKPLARLEGALQLRRLPALSPWVLVSARKDG